MKKFSNWFYALVCVFLYLLTVNSFAESNLQQKGLLWSIKKTGLTTSYLFGTIHSDDPRVMKLPTVVRDRLEKSDSLTLEIKLGIKTIVQAFGGMFLENGQTLDNLIGKELFKQVVQSLEQHEMPAEFINTLKPWVVMDILSMPQSNTEKFLDLYLHEEAERLGKAQYGLETVEEQINASEKLTISEQVILLQDTLEHLSDMSDIYEKLHQLYLEREISEILTFYDEYMEENPHKALYEKYMKYLLDDRNLVMLKRMEPRLQEGNAFIAVGAMHLPGRNGLIHLLQSQGYIVSPLY